MDAYLTDYLSADVRGYIEGFLNMADQLMMRMSCKKLFAEITRPNSTIWDSDSVDHDGNIQQWSMEAMYEAAYNNHYDVYIQLCMCTGLSVISKKCSEKWLAMHGFKSSIGTTIPNIAAMRAVGDPQLGRWKPLWDDRAMIVAAYAGRIDVVNYLMYSIHFQKKPLKAAIKMGNVALVKMIVSHPNMCIELSIHESETYQAVILTPKTVRKAIERNQFEMVEWLLDFGVKFTTDDIIDCVKIITPEMFRLLYQRLYNDNPASATGMIIFAAIEFDRVDIINWLHQTYPGVISPTIYQFTIAAGAENIQYWLFEHGLVSAY